MRVDPGGAFSRERRPVGGASRSGSASSRMMRVVAESGVGAGGGGSEGDGSGVVVADPRFAVLGGFVGGR